jgi:hypothetical protein
MDQVTADKRYLARIECDIAATGAAIKKQVVAIRHLAQLGQDTTIHNEVLNTLRMCETAQLNHRQLLLSEIENEPLSAELRNRSRLAIAESRRLLANSGRS